MVNDDSNSENLPGLLRELADSSEAVLAVDLAAERLFSGLCLRPKIDRFEILEVLGAGGMGTVYAARDPETGSKVALKVVGGPSSAANQARLIREGRLGSRLDHPAIVGVQECVVQDDRVVLVMEFVNGLTLDQWLVVQNPDLAAVLELFVRAGAGLAAAHAAGVVHRDFKPSNVIVDRDGQPHIVDFGLARPIAPPGSGDHALSESSSFEYSITATGGLTGTRAYMAPELFSGAPPSPSTDIYAFCVTLLEILRTKIQISGSGARLRVPRELTRALLRGVEPNPSARWLSMDALVRALSAVGGSK